MFAVIVTSRPSLFFGGAGFQANRPCSEVDLAHLEVDEFADSPSVCPAHLDYRLEPEIGAVCDQLLVLCVFEEAGTDVVLSELGEFGQTKDLRRRGEHADTEHPLARSHLAIDRRIGGVFTLAMVNVFRYQIACDFHDPARPEERLDMQPPAGLYIIGRLPPIDAVIAEEILRQFADSNPLCVALAKKNCLPRRGIRPRSVALGTNRQIVRTYAFLSMSLHYIGLKVNLPDSGRAPQQ